MTPILLGSVIIINEAGLHRCTGGVAFRKVTDGERQGGTGMGQHPEHAVWSEGGKEVLKMCVSALKSACWNFAKFEQNL